MPINADTTEIIMARFLGHVVPSAAPTFYGMIGIPGAGKTTFVDTALAHDHFPKSAFLLNPDRVMNAIPQYVSDFATHGAQAAFERWEMPARNLAYDMLDRAISMRADIVQDMGCSRMENYEKIKALKNSGYTIVMTHIDCAVDEALRRIADRPRHTPKEMVLERAESIQTLLPLYRGIADRFSTVST